MIMGKDMTALRGKRRGEFAVASGVLGKAVMDEHDGAGGARCPRMMDMERGAGLGVECVAAVEHVVSPRRNAGR